MNVLIEVDGQIVVHWLDPYRPQPRPPALWRRLILRLAGYDWRDLP